MWWITFCLTILALWQQCCGDHSQMISVSNLFWADFVLKKKQSWIKTLGNPAEWPIVADRWMFILCHTADGRHGIFSLFTGFCTFMVFPAGWPGLSSSYFTHIHWFKGCFWLCGPFRVSQFSHHSWQKMVQLNSFVINWWGNHGFAWKHATYQCVVSLKIFGTQANHGGFCRCYPFQRGGWRGEGHLPLMSLRGSPYEHLLYSDPTCVFSKLQHCKPRDVCAETRLSLRNLGSATT